VIYPYRVVAVFGLSFLLGVLAASYLQLSLLTVWMGLGLFGAVLFLRPGAFIKLIAIFGLGLLLGWWRYDVVAQSIPDSVSQWADEEVVVRGRVSDDPEIVDNQQKLQLKVLSVDDQRATGKILLTTWPLPRYAYGDELEAEVKVTVPRSSATFDYAAYLKKDGIYALGQSTDKITIIKSASISVLGVLYKLKNWLAGQINQLLPEPDSALMNGLLLGLRTQLPESFKTALQYSGTTHIIALSGFNITIIAGFFMWLFSRTPRRLGLIGAGIGILLFILMTGAASSVVRAAIMGWVMLLTAWWGRKRSLSNAVLIAAVVMVAFNPFVLQYDAAFQLSVAATAGLVYLTPHLLVWLRHLPTVLKEAAATTLAATTAVFPLIIFHFGGFSLYTLLANLLVVPLVPVTMLLGFATLVVFAVFPFLQFVGLIDFAFTRMLVSIINFFSSLPYAFVEVPPLSSLAPVLYYLLLIISIHLLNRAKVAQI